MTYMKIGIFGFVIIAENDWHDVGRFRLQCIAIATFLLSSLLLI